jgi:phage tail protein X
MASCDGNGARDMITGFELVTVAGTGVTCDMLVWRRYRRRAPGIVEALLDCNPHLAIIHRDGPFIPAGVQVRIPIDLGILAGGPKTSSVTLWADNLRI